MRVWWLDGVTVSWWVVWYRDIVAVTGGAHLILAQVTLIVCLYDGSVLNMCSAAARAPSYFLDSLCTLWIIVLQSWMTWGPLGALAPECFVSTKEALVRNSALCHPQCKFMYRQEKHVSSLLFFDFCSLCSRYTLLHLFIGIPKGVLKSFSVSDIPRRKRTGF